MISGSEPFRSALSSLLKERGGKLIVSGVRTPIDRIFRMSGLYALVERA